MKEVKVNTYPGRYYPSVTMIWQGGFILHIFCGRSDAETKGKAAKYLRKAKS